MSLLPHDIVLIIFEDICATPNTPLPLNDENPMEPWPSYKTLVSFASTCRSFRHLYLEYEERLLRGCFWDTVGPLYAAPALLLANSESETFNLEGKHYSAPMFRQARRQGSGREQPKLRDMKSAMRFHARAEWLADFAVGALEAVVEGLDIDYMTLDEEFLGNLRFATADPDLGDLSEDMRNCKLTAEGWMAIVYAFLIFPPERADRSDERENMWGEYTDFFWLVDTSILTASGYKNEPAREETRGEGNVRNGFNQTLFKVFTAILYLLIKTELRESMLQDEEVLEMIHATHTGFIGNLDIRGNAAEVRVMSICNTVARRLVQHDWDTAFRFLRDGITDLGVLRRALSYGGS